MCFQMSVDIVKPCKHEDVRAFLSAEDTILLETQIIHRLIDSLLDLLPVRPALDEFVYVLGADVHGKHGYESEKRRGARK